MTFKTLGVTIPFAFTFSRAFKTYKTSNRPALIQPVVSGFLTLNMAFEVPFARNAKSFYKVCSSGVAVASYVPPFAHAQSKPDSVASRSICLKIGSDKRCAANLLKEEEETGSSTTISSEIERLVNVTL